MSHSGPLTSRSFIQILVLTDVASGWPECAPLLFRKQQLLAEVLTVLREGAPLPILGFDTDNDTVCINETVKAQVARPSPARAPAARKIRHISSKVRG